MKLKDRLFMSLRGLIRKYKDFILYVLFGVLSTLLNIVSYWFFAHVLLCGTIVSTVIAWILTVFFVYVTNRKWVFHSSATTAKEYVKEIISFFSCRIATGLVDWGCMVVFVTLLEFHDVMIKTLANVLVILLNYVASKVIVFKKK